MITMSIIIVSYLLSTLVSKNTLKRKFRLRRNWLRVANWILNIKVDIIGAPPLTPALYISNHRSFSDPLILLKYLNAFVIAKAEVADYPVINKGAELTGIVYVRREDRDSRQATRDKMIEVIKSGYNVLVYPEGTVGQNKETLPFKMGTFMEAAVQKIPVVPIAVEYKSAKDLWTNPNFLRQYLFQYSKWKTHVKMEFGPVLNSDDGEELHDMAYDWVNGKIEEMQVGWSESFGK